MESFSLLTPGNTLAGGGAVRRLLAPNAGLMTGAGTNTYLLGTDEIAVLDPGPNDASHERAILAACTAPIRWVIVTHTHRDHSPLANVLAARCGAQLIGLPPPVDGRQDSTFRPDREPADGERLQLGGLELTAIHTPGHASNCVCYLLGADRVLFTGDHVLQGVSPVIFPPDGDMTAYLDSLDKILARDFDRIAPGHGHLIEEGRSAVASLRAHRLAREAKILRVLARVEPLTIEQLTPAVYDDVAEERHVWARLTLEAHLIKLARERRVAETGGLWRIDDV